MFPVIPVNLDASLTGGCAIAQSLLPATSTSATAVARGPCRSGPQSKILW
jgi:hypothetical protein